MIHIAFQTYLDLLMQYNAFFKHLFLVYMQQLLSVMNVIFAIVLDLSHCHYYVVNTMQ